jgi:trk system potassium uptake protein
VARRATLLGSGCDVQSGCHPPGYGRRMLSRRRDTELRFRDPSRRVPSLSAHVGGAALLFVAAGMVVSALVEAGAGGEHFSHLMASAGLVALAGFLLWRSTEVPAAMTASSTFVAVGSTWLLASIGGAVPFVLTDTFATLDDALFESISGFTGTGSTVLAPIEAAPRGVLFWRNLTQWYGGTGIVVLAVAILPFLGVGGMDMLSAEAPGPTTDRLAPRISETARRLWQVYAGLTVLAIVLLLAVGMSPFDAVTHAFTAVSTGGLSPYDASIAAFDSLAVELVLVGLMLVSAAAFTLHWRAVTGRPRAYLESPHLRFYLGVFVAFVALVTALLWTQQDLGLGQALRDATFNVASLLTSTGFGTADFAQWVPGAQVLLLMLMVSGGMAGSTSGGLKLVRVRVLLVHAGRELRRIRHPRAVLPVRLGPEAMPERIVQRVIGYALLYVVFIGLGCLALTFLGAELTEAAAAAASAMGNMGPALGEAGPASNFLYFSRPARGLLMVMMLAGRLEIFPVLYVIGRLSGALPGGPFRRALRRTSALAPTG